MNKIVIIGYGSAGRRHARIINNNFKNIEINILTKQRVKKFRSFKNLNEIKKINPDYIIIASETIKHLNQLKYLEKNFKNKKILIEKPLFHKSNNLIFKRNNIFINYNLRFNPYIQKLKKFLDKKFIYDIKLITNSYLPNWRKNISYKKNYSVDKSKGGGVILDLSHDIDIIMSLFNKVSINYVSFGRKSNLTKNSEDFLYLNARSNKVNISLDINYYSRNELRLIFVDGRNFSLNLDLKNNIFKLCVNNKIYKITKKYSQDFTFLKTHEAIISGKNSKSLCKIEDGKKVLRFIEDIKNN
jgi:predicted dehydrogenase